MTFYEQQKLSIGDLSELLRVCNEPFHFKYAVKGVKLFQKSGGDFNEETCSLFIKVCVRSDKPQSAADLILDQRARISSWLCRSSLSNLVEGLLKCEGGVTVASKIVLQSWTKGVFVATPDVIGKIVQESSGNPENNEIVGTLLTGARGKFQDSVVDAWIAQCKN